MNDMSALVPPEGGKKDLIKDLSHTHEAMMDWMLMNPGHSLTQMSAAFGYTVPWLSRLIHSDIFQARLAERRKEVELRICDDIPAKLRGLGHLAIERMEEKLAASPDPRFIRESFDSIMHRLGYAPQARVAPQGVNLQLNAFVVSKEELQTMQGHIVQGTSTSCLTESGDSAVPSVGETFAERVAREASR